MPAKRLPAGESNVLLYRCNLNLTNSYFMKKIKLKLEELTSPEVLTSTQMKNITGAGFCYTGMSCSLDGAQGTCTSTPAGNDCYCTSEYGYGSSPWCG